MRFLTFLFCAALCNAAAASSLDELEQLAVEAALESRVAALEAIELEHRLEAARAETGPEFFAGAGIGRVREPLTEDVMRDYERTSMHVGIRLPLLGARETLDRRITALETELERALVRREQTTGETRHRVRLAYLDYLRATERARLAQAFLALQPTVEPLLEQRKRRKLLLEVDRLAFMSMFDTARRNLLREQALSARALARLRMLTGAALTQIDATPPAFATSCLDRDRVIAELAKRPEQQLLTRAIEGQRKLHAQQQWTGIHANIALSQGVTQDIGDGRGYSTMLGVDVTVPLSVGSLRDARRAEHIAALTRLELMLEQQKQIDVAAVEAAFADLYASDEDVRAAQRKFQAAGEGVRVASLRAKHLEGDVYEQALHARYALYQAALDYSESPQRHEQAQAALLALASPCIDATAAPAFHLTHAVTATLSSPLDANAPHSARAIDWFVWEGDALLDDLGLLDHVPAHSRRLLLSFTGERLQSFTTTDERERLHALLASAHSRGLRVDLLLGEPTGVLPEHRPKLLALISSMRSHAFDGINLDLERSQLAEAQQAGWTSNVLETLRAVARRSPLPLTLTTHYREFENEAFTRALADAGVSEIMPMIYIADAKRVSAIAAAIARIDPSLRVTVAQSMEPELSAAESLHGAGRAAATAHWLSLSKTLASQPNFGGIAVQSLQTYREARP